jgi:disulfide bond formation protein DsbB
MIRSSTLQRIAEIVMVAGIVALCQPWNLFLHRYGVTIILAGLVTFMLTNWFGSKGETVAEGTFDVSDHHDGKAGGHS